MKRSTSIGSGDLPLLLAEDGDRGLAREAVPVRTVAHQRIVVVDHGEHPGADGDGFLDQALRVSLAIPSLVVRAHEGGDGPRKRETGDEVGADLRVDANLVEFLDRQRAGLGEDVVGHGELADVEQQGGRPQGVDVGRGEIHRLREGRAPRASPLEALARRFVLGVDGPGQGLDEGCRSQVGLRLASGSWGCPLAPETHRPGTEADPEGERTGHLLPAAEQDCDHRGRKPPPGATTGQDGGEQPR